MGRPLIPVPAGFAERLAMGEAITSLAVFYNISYNTALRLAKSPEVCASIEELREASRNVARRRLCAKTEHAADRLIALMDQDGDKGVALKATITLLQIAGFDLSAKLPDAAASEVATLPDEELQALVERKRAALLGHPVPATVGPIDVEAGDEG